MNETGDSVAEMTQAHRNAGTSKYVAGGPPYPPVRMEAWDRQR